MIPIKSAREIDLMRSIAIEVMRALERARAEST